MGTWFTLGDIAERFKIPTWRVRRLFERGLLAEPPRAGSYRIVHESDLPRIERALRAAGYLTAPEGQEVAHAAS